MTDPTDLQARIVAAAPEFDLQFRKMFGGIMGYANGAVFASLSNVGLALKFTGADHRRALALTGAEPLRCDPGDPPSKSYVVMPLDVVADSETLHGWIVASVAALKPKPVKA